MKFLRCIVLAALLMAVFTAIPANATDRLVLAEMFTNTSCGPCYNANLTLDQLVNAHPNEFVAIRYHVWWPSNNDPFYRYNTSENTVRTNYYGVSGVPALKVDGFIDGGGYPSYWSRILNRYYMESPMEIVLSGNYDEDSNSGTLDISITATDDYYYDSLYVRIALTETDLYWPAPNGLNYHDQVMRDMIPNAFGTGFDISYGETVDFSESFACPSQLVLENCELVVWVQSDYLREVYQTARIRVEDLGPVSIDDVTELPVSFSLNQNYPNPFNAGTTISYNLEKENQVTIDIYDLNGRQVAVIADGIQPAGNHQVIWDGVDSNGSPVSSGVYFYRMSTNSESFVKRMVLLK